MNTSKTKCKKKSMVNLCEELSTLPCIGEIIGILPMYGKMIKDMKERKYKLHIGTSITLVIGSVCMAIPKEKLKHKFPLIALLNKKLIASFIQQSLRAELGKYVDQIDSVDIEWEECPSYETL